MRSKIQVKLVTEHVRYLEKQIRVMEPVVDMLKTVVEKSRSWTEEKTDHQSVTYSELCQELESATTAMLEVSSDISNENKEHVVIEEGTSSLFQSTPLTTATETRDQSESTHPVTQKIQQTDEIFSRLDRIETIMSSLLDTKQKTDLDISELKQWRDTFATEQMDMQLQSENWIRKEKLNFKNFEKQIIEQDYKLKELNTEIKIVKENETKSNKTLEKLSLDMKEYENNFHKINEQMYDYTDKTDSMTQEIIKQSNVVSVLRVKVKQNKSSLTTKCVDLSAKCNLMYKLLQQRLMVFDKLNQIFSQNLETRERNIRKLGTVENNTLKLLKDFHTLETQIFNRYACYIQLADPTPVKYLSTISTFEEVMEYNGHHFNERKGAFVSPRDGLYLVSVTLHEADNKKIDVGVYIGGRSFNNIKLACADTSATGSVVVDMKQGQELYFQVDHADHGAVLSWHSSFTIVSL